MGTDNGHSIGTRTLRGMLWSYGSFTGVRLASLVTTAILARLLVPKDFGLIALAMTFMAFLDMLQGLGVGEALVVVDEQELEAQAETAFVISTASGVLLWLVAAGLGPVAASFFHQSRLGAVLPALGLTFFFYGLGSTHYALAMKRIDFRSRTAAELADAIVRGGVGITLALAGAGVWSLVAGYVAGTAAMTVVVWRMVSWRPRFRPRRAHVRRLLGFGGSLTGVGIMGAFLSQFDNGVIGRVLGATQLGFYSIANRLPYLFVISLAAATGQVLFPAFAALKGAEMRRGFLLSLRFTAAVALPLAATLIVLAEPLTLAVFGPRWRPAVPATQVMCLWAVMSPISMVCGNALKARGRAFLLFLLAIPQAVALVIGSLLLVHQGIIAVAWVQAGIAIVAQVVTLRIASRLIGLTLRPVLIAIAPALLASAVLAAVLLVIAHEITDPWLAIVVGGVIGGALYVGLMHRLMPDLLGRLRDMAFPRKTSDQAPPPPGDDAQDGPVAVSLTTDATSPSPP
jgi:O-antigen/teichoic acid export membrane protein